MTLMQQWDELAEKHNQNRQMAERFWADYYTKEKAVYEKILSQPAQIYTGTVQEMADQFGMDVVYFGAFLDGINESVRTPNPVKDIEADSQVSIDVDLEKLYYNMVGAKAEWLYTLPEWDDLIPEERRKELYKEQKKSGTVVKPKKIGRNDPCPCGSGKKYKFCHGRTQK